MITTEQFILESQEIPESNIRYGKVDPAYDGSGRPSLVFDGEVTATVKKYPYLSSYTPVANDRVMILKGVIIGKIL
jgi:hypothetical protein